MSVIMQYSIVSRKNLIVQSDKTVGVIRNATGNSSFVLNTCFAMVNLVITDRPRMLDWPLIIDMLVIESNVKGFINMVIIGSYGTGSDRIAIQAGPCIFIKLKTFG